MLQRILPPRTKAANDNFVMRRRAARPVRMAERGNAAASGRSFVGAPLRLGLRPLMMFAFAGLVLLALSSAFLIGLAAVGLLALAVGGFETCFRRAAPGRVAAGYLITGR